LDEPFVGGLPCIANSCGLAIGNGDGMDVVGILMVENEKVVVASGGRDRELACLIRVALQERLVMKKDSTDVMSARSKIWGQIEVRIGRIVKDKLSRANAARFLILMA
jgi:anti-sigma-K factor RskA